MDTLEFNMVPAFKWVISLHCFKLQVLLDMVPCPVLLNMCSFQDPVSSHYDGRTDPIKEVDYMPV